MTLHETVTIGGRAYRNAEDDQTPGRLDYVHQRMTNIGMDTYDPKRETPDEFARRILESHRGPAAQPLFEFIASGILLPADTATWTPAVTAENALHLAHAQSPADAEIIAARFREACHAVAYAGIESATQGQRPN